PGGDEVAPASRARDAAHESEVIRQLDCLGGSKMDVIVGAASREGASARQDARIPREAHVPRGALAGPLAGGAVRLGSVGAGLALGAAVSPVALLLLPVGVIALRGCPMCWLAGLLQIVSAGRVRGGCAGGECARGGGARRARCAGVRLSRSR